MPAGSTGSGSQAGNPGFPGTDPRSGSSGGSTDNGSSGQRDGSTGDLDGGNPGGLGGTSAGGGGDYTLDTLPGDVFGGDGSGAQQSAGTMTTSEQAGVLDEQLRRGYEVFDGLILGERERAQAERDSSPVGQGGGGDVGGAGSAASQPQTMPAGSAGGPQQTGIPAGSIPSSSPPAGETFPPPEDIPSGRDDDVVARQLREAAMREPDPELREALWDEYRNYTGISEQE